MFTILKLNGYCAVISRIVYDYNTSEFTVVISLRSYSTLGLVRKVIFIFIP